MAHPHEHAILPILFVGRPYSPLAAALEGHGFGVIATERAERAVRMLGNFTVAAVVYDLPTLDSVGQFAALGTPVIALAPTGSVAQPGVTVLPRDATAAAVAEAIQQRAGTCEQQPQA